MFITSGIYPWSFVTQIFHNGQPSYCGDRKTVSEYMIPYTSTRQRNRDIEISFVGKKRRRDNYCINDIKILNMVNIPGIISSG